MYFGPSHSLPLLFPHPLHLPTHLTARALPLLSPSLLLKTHQFIFVLPSYSRVWGFSLDVVTPPGVTPLRKADSPSPSSQVPAPPGLDGAFARSPHLPLPRPPMLGLGLA